MTTSVETLPDDPVLLKALLAKSENKTAAFEKQIKTLNTQLATLSEALRLERHRHFAPKSEKALGQGELFDEAESDAEEQTASDDQDAASTVDTQQKTKPKKAARKPLPADLPRIDQVSELSETERTCPCGCTLKEIGEEISEQLDIEPAKVRVIRHIRKKYACSGCDETVRSAPAPNLLLPKAIASANTMAYVITSKYADGLPLYRLSHILKRYGIEIPRQTLSESVLSTALKLQPLVEHLVAGLNTGPVVHMDETRVQVLNEPDKSAQSQSYMWVRRGGMPDQPVIHFHYDPGRSTSVPETLLSGYSGVLMSDGYEPYRKVAALHGLTHLCCWAHARRKFVEAQKVQPKGKAGRADKALAFIAKLYAVEKLDAASDAVTRHRNRINKSAPLLRDLHEWLEDAQQKVPPKNALGKAINYTLKYWPELSRYVDNGDWPIDNNAAENAIRPFVIGRKAWLFSNSQRGVRASANLYSIIETAKANKVEPYRYLCWLLNKLPEVAANNIGSLAPWNMPADFVAP